MHPIDHFYPIPSHCYHCPEVKLYGLTAIASLVSSAEPAEALSAFA